MSALHPLAWLPIPSEGIQFFLPPEQRAVLAAAETGKAEIIASPAPGFAFKDAVHIFVT